MTHVQTSMCGRSTLTLSSTATGEENQAGKGAVLRSFTETTSKDFSTPPPSRFVRAIPHGSLRVIWVNALAHRGEALRSYLKTPDINLRLVNLPGYSPDFNADEAIWGWAREEAAGNLCPGTRGRQCRKGSVSSWQD